MFSEIVWLGVLRLLGCSFFAELVGILLEAPDS